MLIKINEFVWFIAVINIALKGSLTRFNLVKSIFNFWLKYEFGMGEASNDK
jgi:hypothetical protein